MSNINEIIKAAKDLGIKLTNAEIGTELCNAWADRVAMAQMHFDRGDMIACQRAIDGFNAYAI
jgi:hypothetical protein